MAAPQRTGATAVRLEKAVRVRELRDQGLSFKEIAEELDIKRSYASALYSDPDGSKDRARKDGYGGRCADCGARTTGSMGRDNAPTRCWRCARGHLDSPSQRRTMPLRLCDVPLDLRLAGVREANRVERGEMERIEILLAALYPSTNVYFVHEGARPLLEAAA